MVANVVPLFTVGYEGRTPNDLAALLRKNRVVRVVDVRQLPLSRKRGFSKSALAVLLRASGLDYINMRELGTPPSVRSLYKETGDFAALKTQYLDHIAGQDPAVERLYGLAIASTCCLLCFERGPDHCHRSLLAGAVAHRNGRQFEVRHL